jgi:hypothetical protein
MFMMIDTSFKRFDQSIEKILILFQISHTDHGPMMIFVSHHPRNMFTKSWYNSFKTPCIYLQMKAIWKTFN